jgi:hypothetical protein
VAAPASAPGAIDRHARALLVAVVAANLLLKLPAMDAQGVWFDEATSIRLAQQPIDLAARMAADASPPLYGVLLSLWMRVLGTSLESVRALSVALSAATAGALFAFGRRFVGPEAGLLAAVLFTTSRVQLHFAHEVRPYALVGLLCVLSFLAFLRLFRDGGRSAAIALALANAALLYAHYLVALALVAQGIAALAAMRSAPLAFRRWLASQAGAAALFLPCAAWVWLHWPPPMAGWDVAPDAGRLLHVASVLAGSAPLLGASAVLLLAAAAWGRLADRGDAAPAAAGAEARPSPAVGLVLWLWLLVPIATGFAVSQLVPIFLHRYLLYVSLALVLLLGRAIVALPVPPAVRVAIAAGLAFASFATHLRAPILRPDWRGAAAIVQAERRPGSVVVVSPPFQLLPFAFHYSRAAFDEPGAGLSARLAQERVIGLRLDDALRAAPDLPTDRVVLAVSEEVAPLSDEAVTRLRESGFGIVEARRLPGVAVVVADRAPGGDGGGASSR